MLSIGCVIILISLLPTCVYTDIGNFSPNFYLSLFPENQPIGTTVLQLYLQTSNLSLLSFSLKGHLHSHFILTRDLVIHSAVILDRETTAQYELTAVALYNNSEIATANVSISIEDVNDNAPYCNASSYSIEVNENYLVDSLLVIQCWDRDVGSNASLHYQLQNNYSTFFINSTGNLGLNQSLDYEQYPDGILIQVIVSDQGDTPLSTQVYVFVDILSVNEFAPQFSDSTMTHIISEHTQPGSRVVKISASDLDSGRGGDVFYFLSSSPEEGLFQLDRYSGALYLLKSLDYESTTMYSLLITASNSPEGAADSLNTTALLELTILDIVEDLRFKSDAEFSTVSEDVQSGTEIASLMCGTSSASSPDITYSFATPVSHLFSIDAASGVVYTVSALNYENQSSYEVPVSCSCCSSPSLKAYAFLFVTLSDVNEFPPVFSSSEYQVTLSEQTEPGTAVLQLSATDLDSGAYGQVQYRLLTHEQMFYLHPTTGILYLREALSYDTESSYNITVLAGNSYSTWPSDPLTTTAIVQVVVTEYFLDKLPNCTKETQLLTLEETTPINQPITQFSCNNNNSTGLNYTLLNSNYSSTPFYVYSNGTLSLRDYLDFEFGSRFYLLEIRATQSHSPYYSSPIFLHVIVSPVNEYTPVLNQTYYSLALSELTAVGSNILNVTANDEDSYPDGGARFTFIAEFDTFSIDPILGYVYLVSPLDYDVTPQYNLSLVATDLSSSPLSSTAAVLIEVTNENTLPPSCYPTRMHVTLPETTPPQSEIARFSCSDPDNLLLASDLLTSLSGQIDQILTVFNSSLVLKSSLDYEQIISYSGLLLVAEPNSSFSFHIAISILVEPYNEFSPHFNNLPANISINSSDVWTLYPVFSVAATDLDAGVDGQVEFYLQDADQEGVFQMDPYTGDLWLISPIQQILNNSIHLTVIATDQSLNNSLANSSTIFIYINRDIPTSCQSYFHSFSVPENASTNSILLRLSCLSPVSYTLNDKTFSELFRITPNGSLLLTLPLDAEADSSHFSSVRVLFSRNTTLTVGISISVEDVNEFAPSFISPPSYYELSADIELGSLLLAFQANDTDLHNQIEYAMTYAVPGLYLSPDTGQLFLSSREIFFLSSPLSISITAKDSDPHPMNSTTELLLNVSVSNVITLSPTKPLFLFSVREDELVGSVVGTVQCTNAVNLSYELEHAASSNYTFSLRRETGELVLTKALNYKENQSYALEMACTSNNINMSAQFITVVSIEDINEYPPIIQQATNGVYLSENTTVGYRLHTISAYDPDNPYTQLFYSMVQPTQASLFTISYLAGEIYLIQELDYELQASYDLNITVYDGEPSDGNTKSSQLILTVLITDINDNSPVCPHVLTLHSTQNTNGSRELVAALNCSDRDSTAITNLSYFEVDTLYENYFELTTQGDPPTWYLYFLPLEARASHNGSLFNAYFHNIKCCDGSSPELCTEMLVLVTTVDKPVPQVGLNATQLALAINTEGLENLITLFLNISHANWGAVVEHFKMLTANILTAYCITNPFRCSIQEDCSSQRQSDWFEVENVVIQDGYPVSTGDGTQLEIHFYVSLPDLPKDPEGATDYVVPGEVLYEIVSNKSDVYYSIISAIAPISNCQNSKELLIYIIATFVIGVLFSMALLTLGYFICKLSKCCKDNAHKVTSRKKVFPDEPERLRVSSIDYEIQLRSMSAEGTQEREADNNMYINPTVSLNSGMSRGRVDVVKVSANSGGVEIEPNQEELPKIKFTEEKEKRGKTPDDSTTMNPFWETNPRFWSFQDKERTEYCVTPLLSEASTSARDTDSPIAEYYSTDVSVFTSQTSLGQASTKVLGKARGRYDLMELASMESLMEQNTMNKPTKSLRPESQNLISSQTTSRSTMLYLPSTPSTASNTSLQELPKCSTAVNIDSQEYNKPLGQNFAPKKAWDQN